MNRCAIVIAAGALGLAPIGGDAPFATCAVHDSPVTVDVHPGAGVGAETATLAAIVTRVAAGLPPILRPRRVQVRIEARAPVPIEAHPVDDAIVVRAAVLPLPDDVWAHELAHLALGELPGGTLVEARVLSILHEGIADAAAAGATGRRIVGTAAERRDVGAPSRLHPEAWLLLLRKRFDAHALGRSLAAALMEAERMGAPAIEPLAHALGRYQAGALASPGDVLGRLVRAADPADRARLRHVLARWSRLDITEGQTSS